MPQLGESIAEATARLAGHVASGNWPAVEVGMKCKACEFNVPGQNSGYDLCWGTQARAEHHLFTLWHLGTMEYRQPGTVRRIVEQTAPRAPRITDLQDEDVAGDLPLQRGWKRQIMAVRTGRAFISPEIVRDAATLMRCKPENYPLFFLDYEGTRCALPSAAGCRPYGQVAFQWSCHVIDRPGAALRHATTAKSPHVAALLRLWPEGKLAFSVSTAWYASGGRARPNRERSPIRTMRQLRLRCVPSVFWPWRYRLPWSSF